MKKTLEKLWYEYLSDECSSRNEEERNLTKQSLVLHEKLLALLTEEQKQAVEKYCDSIFAIDEIYAKKAFIKGCEFSVSFLMETIKGK